MLQHIIAVRHGICGMYTGKETPLLPEGVAQARRLGENLSQSLSAGTPVFGVCSDTIRAWQTLSSTELCSRTFVLMRELEKGNWSPERLEADREALEELIDRIMRIADAEHASCVLVVTHGSTPADLVITALRKMRVRVPPQLQQLQGVCVEPASGYMADLSRGDVWKIGPSGSVRLSLNTIPEECE